VLDNTAIDKERRDRQERKNNNPFFD